MAFLLDSTYFMEFSMQNEGSVPSMLGSLHASNTEDRYVHGFYEARQMCVLKEFQVSVICLLMEG